MLNTELLKKVGHVIGVSLDGHEPTPTRTARVGG